MAEPHNDEFLPLDEVAWQGWLRKNRREQHARLARRLEISVLLAPVALAAVCVWFFGR